MYKRARADAIEEREAAPEQRMEMTREQMVTAVLQLFEERESWSKRDIKRLTNQEDKLVTDVVKELALPSTNPEQRNEYVLRDEFKINAPAPKKKKQ